VRGQGGIAFSKGAELRGLVRAVSREAAARARKKKAAKVGVAVEGDDGVERRRPSGRTGGNKI